MALLLELLNQSFLPVRAHASLHIRVRNADFIGNRAGRPLLVTGREQDLDAHRSQRIDRLTRLSLDLVGEGHDTREGTVDGDDDAGTTERFFALAERFEARRKRNSARRREVHFAADLDPMSRESGAGVRRKGREMTRHVAADALSRHRLEALHLARTWDLVQAQ